MLFPQQKTSEKVDEKFRNTDSWQDWKKVTLMNFGSKYKLFLKKLKKITFFSLLEDFHSL